MFPFRFITAIALLVHSVFGCSLHAACACEGHVHVDGEAIHAERGCLHTHGQQELSTDGHESCCHGEIASPATGAHHDHCEHRSDEVVSSYCLCCESAPHGHGRPCGDGSVRCSFVPSTENLLAASFHDAVALVVFVEPPTVSKEVVRYIGQHRTLATFYDRPQCRCAALCTWLI
ncbi:hypothetical protein [Rhodopirellula sp. MGV]|uniref:hypothetical protein n=1 Tax=Rhodopirellula sp. MGV TaxID=2023130 RepID=UPI00117B1C2E|nr:hypothetical protein [Rhodopirellula sp. MGV]